MAPRDDYARTIEDEDSSKLFCGQIGYDCDQGDTEMNDVYSIMLPGRPKGATWHITLFNETNFGGEEITIVHDDASDANSCISIQDVDEKHVRDNVNPIRVNYVSDWPSDNCCRVYDNMVFINLEDSVHEYCVDPEPGKR